MKTFNVKENIQVVTSRNFKEGVKFAVENTEREHNAYGVTMYDLKFVGTIVTFNPTNNEVESFSVRGYIDSSNKNEVKSLIDSKLASIAKNEEYCNNELITIIKASEFEYHGYVGYDTKEQQELRALKVDNKFMSLYIDIVNRMNEDSRSIDELGLSVRSTICLKRGGYETAQQVKNASLDEIIRVRNLGRRSIEEIENVLAIKFR